MYYDPMLAKIISWAPTRRQAAGLLADALARTRIHGVRTNRDLLVNVLRHPAFLDGATDTAFFDTHGLAELAAPLADARAVELSALAAALADAAAESSGGNGIRRGTQWLAQRHVGLPDQALQRHRGRDARGPLPLHPLRCGTGRLRCGEPRVGFARSGGAGCRRCGPAVRRRAVRRRRVRRLDAGTGATRRAASLPRSDGRTRARFPAGADARLGAAHRCRGGRHRHRGPAVDLDGSHEDGTHRCRARRRSARRTQRRTGPAGRGRHRTRPCRGPT